jgi:hypothetical protein
MPMLSEDDLNLSGLSDEELDRAWDLWFDLAQATNDHDSPYTHGVFVTVRPDPAGGLLPPRPSMPADSLSVLDDRGRR